VALMASGRARGQLSRAQVDGGWPYQVAVPTFAGPEWGGFYNRMLDWAHQRSVDWKRGATEDGMVRFCFAAIESASAFQIAFGGELTVIEPKRMKLKAWEW
jgi:hypothetical protein